MGAYPNVSLTDAVCTDVFRRPRMDALMLPLSWVIGFGRLWSSRLQMRGLRPRRRGRQVAPTHIETLEVRTLLTRPVYCVDRGTLLYTMDPTVGQITIVGSMEATMLDIAFDPLGNLYGLGVSTLYRLDPATGQTLSSRSLQFSDPVDIRAISGMTSSPDGDLLVAGETLCKLDVDTGELIKIGGLSGLACGGDLAFDSAGNLYMATTTDDFARINPATGASTVIGNLGLHNNYGLEFVEGTMYGFSDVSSQVFAINLATGAPMSIVDFSGPTVDGVFGASVQSDPVIDVRIESTSPTRLEGDSGVTEFTFDVIRTGKTQFASSVNYSVAGIGIAPADAADFDGTFSAGTLNFLPGESTKTITINVKGDMVPEGDESFRVTISDASTGSTIVGDTANATIQNDDFASLSIAATGGPQAEGNSGFTDISFTVTRSGDLGGSATVSYAVTGIGTFPANGADFGGALPSGVVSFLPNESVKFLIVHVQGDTLQESDEGFRVTLSNPSVGTSITTASATGSILNDDSGTLAITSVTGTQQEGNTGSRPFIFSVARSGSINQAASVQYAVSGSGGTPADVTDFGGAFPSGTINFLPNETTLTIVINVQGDLLTEADEGFVVTLSNPTGGASITTGTASGLIQNDDIASLSVAATSAIKNEGDAGQTPFTFTVTRSGALNATSTVDYAITGSSNAPANAADFGGTLPSGTLTFLPNETTKVITVDVSGDVLFEQFEGFQVTLSNASSGTQIATGTALGTIINDDLATLDISATSGNQLEGNSGFTSFVFTVTRTGVTNGAGTVNYTIAGDGANPANAADFGGTFPSGVISFSPNETVKVITVLVQGENLLEPDEGFVVTLSNPNDGALLATPFATSVIQNDDANQAPTNITLNPSSIAENNPTNATVGPLTATDPDVNDTFTFSLVAGAGSTDNASFTIVGNSLRITPSTDFEAKNSYSIRVRVADQDGASFEKPLTVSITNVNESPTDVALSSTSIAEHNAPHATVGTLSATDPDTGSTFTYSLVGGAGSTDNASFEIVGNELQILGSANFDTKPNYNIRIRVTDQGGLTFDKPFTITVIDLNEPPTDITLNPSSVAENNAANATVGTLSATDPDAGNTFTFTLVSGTGSTDNGSFSIVGNTLRITPSANFEAKNSYSVRIRVADQAGASFQKQFTINVTDVNEAPTGLGLSHSSISENNAPNAVIGVLIPTDPDAGNTFTYALVDGAGSTDNASFAIVGNVLQILPSTDFEVQNSYSVRIRVTDQGGLSFDKPFTISILDQNEAPTEIAFSPSSIAENNAPNAVVGTFNAIDPDIGNTFTYSLVTGTGSTDNASFNIAGNTLQIVPSANFEVNNSYSIRVRVTDQFLAAFEKQLTITITDVNEAPTNLALSTSHIVENNAPNSTIGLLNTTDPDQGNTFTYSLVAGAGGIDNASFTIVGNTLQITPETDFEAQNTYSIRIRVTDQGGLLFEKPFTINVLDSNEAPSLADIADQTILEDNPTPSILAHVEDPETPSASLIVTGTSSNQQLIPDANIALSGSDSNRTLILTPAPNRSGSATITVTVSDGTNVAEQTFIVLVQPVDDPPVITLNAAPLVLAKPKPTAIDRGATISDIDTPVLVFDQAVLEVSSQGKDKFRILKLDGIRRKKKTVVSGTTMIGSLTGGKKGLPLVIHLNSSATQPIVEKLLRAIAIKLVKATSPRQVHMQITDIAGIDTNLAERQVERQSPSRSSEAVETTDT